MSESPRQRQRQLDAIVFDIGETIVDESRLWCSWADWLHVPRLTLLGLIGAGIELDAQPGEVLRELVPGIDIAAERLRRHEAGDSDEFTAEDLYPDVQPALSALQDAGYRVGIAGNQPEAWEDFLRQVPLPQPLACCGSSGTWRVSKPKPGFFQRICAELSLPPDRIAYVGDRLDHDVIPALDAGMVAVHIRRGPWGHRHATRPGIERATLRIDSLSELPDALATLDR